MVWPSPSEWQKICEHNEVSSLKSSIILKFRGKKIDRLAEVHYLESAGRTPATCTLRHGRLVASGASQTTDHTSSSSKVSSWEGALAAAEPFDRNCRGLRVPFQLLCFHSNLRTTNLSLPPIEKIGSISTHRCHMSRCTAEFTSNTHSLGHIYVAIT